MKTSEIRKLSTADLEKKVVELKAELFNLRFRQAVGQLEDTSAIGKVRKTIAQMKTIINERNV